MLLALGGQPVYSDHCTVSVTRANHNCSRLCGSLYYYYYETEDFSCVLPALAGGFMYHVSD